MINPDDLELPRKGVTKPRDLQPMSVEELHEYIILLETEIGRIEDMIAKKMAHKNGLDTLFGSGEP